MNKQKHISPPKPPRWASRFLKWYCKPSLYEDLQGDLLEYFERNVEKRSATHAKLIYVVDVFKFFRVYTVQKPQILKRMNQFIMFGNYFKTSVRSMARNRLFTAINIVGLAISLSVGLLMISFLADIYSYDTFHKNYRRIYRVGNTYKYMDQDESRFASTSIQAATRIKNEVAGIEDMVLMSNNFHGDVTFKEKTIAIAGPWVQESFFRVFSFTLLKGDPATALKEPYSLVLSETTARKLFADEDPLGKIVRAGDKDNYTVTGVMEDMPSNSHIRSEALASWSTYEAIEKAGKHPANLTRWNMMWSNYIYMVPREDQDVRAIEAAMAAISDDENSRSEYTKINLFLQPLSQIVPGENLSNQIGPTMELRNVWVIGILTVVVLISACFNYTNLSVARALRRSKEVGIRKLVGASRGAVFGQFMFESVIISLLSVVFAFFLYYLGIRPRFLEISATQGDMIHLQPSFIVFLYFLLLAIVIGILAGFFPSVFFSRIQAFKVIKGGSGVKLFGNLTIRRALIVFQFTLSLAFIIGATMAYRQYQFAVNFDLGYKTKNILNVDVQGNDFEKVKSAFSQIPEISAISGSFLVTSVGSYWATNAKYKDPLDSTGIYYNGVDEHYIPMHGLEIIAGGNFTPQAGDTEENQVIINEKLVKRFNMGEPGDAIGETLTIDKKPMKVVGVVKDFHYGKIDSPINEFAYRYKPGELRVLNAVIFSDNLPETMEKIETAWNGLDTVHPLKARFYDEKIQESYYEYLMMVKIIGFMAFLAISIASLGLLGMVVFTTETRLKEISIRKVLGATEQGLVLLLGRGFVFLLLISAAIAVPGTWYFFNEVVFSDLTYKASFGFFELFGGVLIVFALAALAIGSQTVQAARTNPATMLRNE